MFAFITLHRLSFVWPDGTVVLNDASAVFNSGRSGLVGDNGAGKSTLLRLIVGELPLTSGTIVRSGDVAYLSQTISPTGATLADLLGVRAKLDALVAIEAGSVDPADYETLGDDWDVRAQAEAIVASLGLRPATGGGRERPGDVDGHGGLSSLTDGPPAGATGGSGLGASSTAPTRPGGIDLERPVSTLSGGEAMAVAVAGVRRRGAAITLLDEPTNNMDGPTRQALIDMIDSWPGALVVVSHDVELLEHMDQTVELRRGRLETFSGGYTAWREAVELAEAAARQAERAAEQDVRVALRQRSAA